MTGALVVVSQVLEFPVGSRAVGADLGAGFDAGLHERHHLFGRIVVDAA